MYAQTTDTTFQISYNGSVTGQMTNEELLLGRMYLFGRSQDVLWHSKWKVGQGIRIRPQRNHMGFFFFDRDARRLKVFGNSDIPFSGGIEEFMDDNLKFHIDYF